MPNQSPTRRQAPRNSGLASDAVTEQVPTIVRAPRTLRESSERPRGSALESAPQLPVRVVGYYDARAITEFRAARGELTEHFNTQMTLASVSSLAGVTLLYHGAVGGGSGYWLTGAALVGGSLFHGILTRRRANATMVALFVREGHDCVQARVNAKAELRRILGDDSE